MQHKCSYHLSGQHKTKFNPNGACLATCSSRISNQKLLNKERARDEEKITTASIKPLSFS